MNIAIQRYSFPLPTLYVPSWHRYPQATLRIECEHLLRGAYAGTFEAEITVYVDPTDFGQWHIGEMSIVGGERVLENGKTVWKDKLIPIDWHPRGGRTEEGFWAEAIERAAKDKEEQILDALEQERV